jgi:hypothetical protein
MPLHDSKNVNVGGALLADERVTGLIDEVGHVDHRQGIGAFKNEHPADRDRAQRFLRAQHGLRAPQSAQVENRFALLTRLHAARIYHAGRCDATDALGPLWL